MKNIFGFILILALVFSISLSASAATIYWPTQSTRVTSEYGMRTINGVTKMHYGMDIGGMTAGVAGDSVRAIHNGTLNSKGWHTSYGNVVFIKHTGINQMNYVNVESVYAHLLSISTTIGGTGSTIYGNTVIGKMGNTGSASAGVHLHLETRNCPTSACITKMEDGKNPRTWFNFISTTINTNSVIEENTEIEESHDHHENTDYNDLTVESPNYYSYEELILLTPDELKAIGYPNPYEFKNKNTK